jgi:hypothetical protein
MSTTALQNNQKDGKEPKDKILESDVSSDFKIKYRKLSYQTLRHELGFCRCWYPNQQGYNVFELFVAFVTMAGQCRANGVLTAWQRCGNSMATAWQQCGNSMVTAQ